MCTVILFAQKKKKISKKSKSTQVVPHNHVDTVVNNLPSIPEKPDAVVGAKLFEFSVLTSKGQVFANKDIPENNNFILMLFNPGCGHCVATTNAIKNRIEEFKNTTILLVTGSNLFDKLKEFKDEVGLKEDSPINVAAELGDGMTKKIFEYRGIPQLMIYDKNKILQNTFYKEIDIDSVLHYIKK